jgi:alpha-L-rhamnosidase
VWEFRNFGITVDGRDSHDDTTDPGMVLTLSANVRMKSICWPVVVAALAICIAAGGNLGTVRLLAQEASTPLVVRARQFDLQQLQNPESVFWPAYFWLWNGPLDPELLKAQLNDMAEHEAKSVCVLPMPRDFRPDTTANRMDVDYLSPEYFERVKVAVAEAARLGMNYWMYDEGGWPSGQATGRVVSVRPDLRAQVMRADANGKWGAQMLAGRPDLLNPAATETFIALTHERYRVAVGKHFRKTIQMVFTDEPAYPVVQDGREVPWTNHGEELFAKRFGYHLEKRLPAAFRRVPAADFSPTDLQTRIDAFDFWSLRFREAYFDRLRSWCRRNDGLAQGGHLGGEDETLGATRYGFGQVMRQLRAMDVPGVDIIWRQVFPGKRNHHFPKFASSAAHQNGTALALTESFCVYGNGLTPAQMKWLIDYQYVRGLNVLVAGCYPLSTNDHHMLGERPHFGPVDPLWDYLPKYHRYVARLGYLLACGEPVIETALYYPVRDLWATGPESAAADTHDALAQKLFERQCDFDVIDDDLLADSQTHVADGVLHAGKMKYRTIVVGFAEQMARQSREQLAELERAGGTVIRINNVNDAASAAQQTTPTVEFAPATTGIRCQTRRWAKGGVVLLFNEGARPYSGRVAIRLEGQPVDLEPSEGKLTPIPGVERRNSKCLLPIQLGASESRVLLFGEDGVVNQESPPATPMSLGLNDGWEARPIRQYRVGQQHYEIVKIEGEPYKPIALGSWNALVGPDFSGIVAYGRRVKLPVNWIGKRLRLSMGKLDYAARVRIDGQEVGVALWSPMCVEFTSEKTHPEFVLTIEVANTLANELTSDRVQKEWARQNGPGWPGPYHQRAVEFEKESRSGGLFGPLRLDLLGE